MVSAGIIGIQVAGVCFGVFMLYLSFLKYKQNSLTATSFYLFCTAWAGVIFMSFFPKILDPLLENLKFGRRLDFFIICGFMFLITLVFYSHLTIISLNKKMESVVREIAFINSGINKQEEKKVES